MNENQTVESRALTLVDASVRTWTAKEMAQQLGCSYSMARTVLIKAWYAGRINRQAIVVSSGSGEQWGYYRSVAYPPRPTATSGI